MENKNSSPLDLVKSLQIEMGHIHLKLQKTTVIHTLELASLEPVGDDRMWCDTSGVLKKVVRLEKMIESICCQQILLCSLALHFTMSMCPLWANLKMD